MPNEAVRFGHSSAQWQRYRFEKGQTSCKRAPSHNADGLDRAANGWGRVPMVVDKSPDFEGYISSAFKDLLLYSAHTHY